MPACGDGPIVIRAPVRTEPSGTGWFKAPSTAVMRGRPRTGRTVGLGTQAGGLRCVHARLAARTEARHPRGRDRLRRLERGHRAVRPC